MKKLKTLKDLGEDECGFGRHHIDRADLRKEAVKWIKWLNNTEPKDDGYIEQEAIIEWIEHFFNITKEDLK